MVLRLRVEVGGPNLMRARRYSDALVVGRLESGDEEPEPADFPVVDK